MEDKNHQPVQWFPGHMAKTRRKIKESLPLVDAVTEILDARIPESSRNPELSDLIMSKPRVVLLNKCDLADEGANLLWSEHFKAMGAEALLVDCRTGKGLQSYRRAVRRVCAEKLRRDEEKGMAGRPLRIMVVGIPNTGKSSFINRMAGKDAAKVEDRVGVTRENRWFAIGNGLELLDTPGVLWPKFEDPAVGDRLAFTGGVKDTVLDTEALAMRLLEILARDYAPRLAERYKMTDIEGFEAHELLELLARKRGMLISGGELNTERAAITLLDEYRGGKLGRITLEKPPASGTMI